MKKGFITLLLFISLSGISQNADFDTDGRTLLATQSTEILTWKTDTVKLKAFLTTVFFPNKEISFDKITIKSKTTIGEKKQKYYFIEVSNTASGIVIVRWVENLGNDFYFDEIPSPTDYFVVTSAMIQGKKECEPNVYILDGKRHWIFGNDPKCLAEGQISACKIVKGATTEAFR